MITFECAIPLIWIRCELSPGILAAIRGTSDRASLSAAYRKADREYRSRNFNLRNLQWRIRVCIHASAQTNRAVCGFTRVCVVGVGKNSVAQFRPSPGDAASPSCTHAHIYVCMCVCVCTRGPQHMKFARAISAWRSAASNGVARQGKRSLPPSRRSDRGELVVTNVPRQNSRPQILPVK